MTVEELIGELKKMPPKAKVMYHCGDDGWVTPSVEYCQSVPRYIYALKTDYFGPIVNLTTDG